MLAYEGLVRIAPTVGARVGQAAALAEARGVGRALAALDAMPPAGIAGYQPYWALRAHLLAMLGRTAEAARAYTRAIALSEDAATREFHAGREEKIPRVLGSE